MTIEIDPLGIEFIEPDRHGCCRVAYRGVVIDGLYRTPETGAGARAQRYYLARAIEERLGRMSNHQQIEIYAAIRLYELNESISAATDIPADMMRKMAELTDGIEVDLDAPIECGVVI